MLPPRSANASIRQRPSASRAAWAATGTVQPPARARVTARYGGKVQAQEVLSQASYYSVNDLRLHFGLGEIDKADLEIRWPNGAVEKIAGVAANRLVTIREGSGIIKTDTFSAKHS